MPGHDIGSFLDSQEQPQAKSCDWIPKSEEFRNFLSSPETHVLHILGEPGSGKSTAAAWLFRTGSTWGDGLRPQLFSFHEKPRASAAWSSLLYQILHLDEIPSAAVHSALEDEDKSSRWKSEHLSSEPWTFSTLRDVFKSVVCRFPDTLRTLYIIDGLDACDESLDEFLGSIVDILQARTSPGVKFLFLSRQIPSLSLADLFQSAGGMLHIDMNETTAHIENVRSFIKHKVDDLCKSRPGVSQLRSEIINELEKRSAGIYLLASLNIKTLMTAEATPDNIRAVVRTLPDNLQAIYSQALDKVAVTKQPSAAALILWVVFAFRPLRSWELAAALALTRQASPIPSNSNLEDQVSLDILGGTGIRELVGTLIRVTSGDVISLVHSSAKDYLLSLAPPALNGSPGDHDWVWKWLGGNQDWEHSLTALASQQLSLKCQDLIAFASGTINPSLSPTPTPLDSPKAGIQALLRYAIENLPDHVRQTPPGHDTNAGFAEFLRSDNGTTWTRHFWMLKDPTQPYKQFSPLEFCCALGLVETVKQLLPNDKYPKTQLSDVQGVGRATEDAIELLTAADLAAMFGNVETLRVLCENMGTPADSDRLIPQTSWKASVGGWVHIGRNYGHFDVPVPAPGTKGEDVANAHQKAVKQLSWYRPLHTAATYGHAAAADYLISRGASLDREDESGKWPIEIAMENKIEPLVQLLLKHHMDSHLQLLHHLIDVGNPNNIKRLVQLHPKFLTNGVDFKTSFGEHSGSILHLSASKGAHPVYQLLTSLGVHPGLEDSKGRQATHYAAASGQSAFVESILADGTTSRSAEDVSGRNPLFYATLGASCCDKQKWTLVPERESTIVALVGDGSRTLSYPSISSALHSLANFSASSTVLWELVHNSSTAEQFETCVRTLCSKAPEITLDNDFLHAAFESMIFPLGIALELASDVNETDSRGRTALHAAAAAEREWGDWHKKLADMVANIDQQDAEGMTALRLALGSSNSQLQSVHLKVEVLLDHGADETCADACGMTPIAAAAELLSSAPNAWRNSWNPKIVGDGLLTLFFTRRANRAELISDEVLSRLIAALARSEKQQDLSAILRSMTMSQKEHWAKHSPGTTPVTANILCTCHEVGWPLELLPTVAKNMESKELQKAYSQAFLRRSREIAQICQPLLAERDVDSWPDHGKSPKDVVDAAKAGDKDGIEFFLDIMKGDVNAVDKIGQTLLSLAAENGRVELTDFLLSRGADVSLPDKDGRTSVYWAAGEGKLEALKLLLRVGAQVSANDVEIAKSRSREAVRDYLEEYMESGGVNPAERADDPDVRGKKDWTCTVL